MALSLQDSFPWDNISPAGAGVQITVDNNMGSCILCGIVKAKTPARQWWPITVGSYLQTGKDSLS